MRRSLRREGYEILTAETVEEALRVLDERSVELILSDHKMPGMSGVQFLAEAARRRPDALRMIITGWTEEIPREQLEELGVCALITKPWAPSHCSRRPNPPLSDSKRRSSVSTPQRRPRFDWCRTRSRT